jgi:YebC/PmpR family DNA-binding regulatory protein
MGRDFENRKNAIFKTAAQKSKLYSKFGKQIYVLAKNGVPDPDANPLLRNLIERAKKEQVPSHVIEKAIQKAAGAGGEDFQTARYEGFGPGGSLVIIDCLTDNVQRTIAEIRNCLSKTGSKQGSPGSAALHFDHLAVLSFKGENEDAVLEAMLNADINVDDIECKNGQITVFVPPAEFFKAKGALLEALPQMELEVQEITFLPQSSKSLTAEDLPMFTKLIDMLNECDDVQDVYHNVTLPSS